MKKTNIIKIIMLFIVLVILMIGISNAMSIEDLTGTTNKDEIKSIEGIGNKVITIFTTIGSVVSVVILTILGIKYMLGSVEEKAEYKKTFMPFIIGATFTFAASTIAGIIYKITINL